MGTKTKYETLFGLANLLASGSVSNRTSNFPKTIQKIILKKNVANNLAAPNV
jgi:hypothetical protein